MQRSLAELYLMRALAMKRSRQKEVDEKVAQGICILPGCTDPIRSRGLCATHRQAYRNQLLAKETPEDRANFENDNVKEGLVLLPGELVRIKRKATSPFASAG